MDEKERTFAPIAGGRGRSTSPETSRIPTITKSQSRRSSRSRSLRRKTSYPNSLKRIYSSQHFDDHTVYPTSDHDDSTGSESDADKEHGDSSDEQMEKQHHHELNEPVEDVFFGIPNRDDVENTAATLQKTKSTRSKKERDPNLVDWDGPDDPENPKNWAMKRKWAATFVVSSFTFISPVSSSMVAPALGQMDIDLGISNEVVSALILSIFILAYAVGPLFLGPLSEVYGRSRVLQLSNLFYLIWNLVCGFAQTPGQMLAFRFLAGLGGSAPLAIGGGVLSDCWSPDQRGKAISIYSLAPLLGPAVGPIAGGFIAANVTWRWVFWSTTMLDAVIQVFGIFFLQETYAPTLLKRKAAKLRKETGNDKLYTEFDDPDRTLTATLTRATYRPFKLLGTQIIIQIIAVYMAYLYGIMYLLLSTFPRLWTDIYQEPIGTGGLNYISLGLGFFLGTQITAPVNDRIYRRLKKRNNGVGRPEFRVPLMFGGSILIPIGLFIYGWTAEYRTFWIGPNIGAAIFAAGAIVCFQCMQTYIVDSYQRYAASGVAAAVVLRSLAGFGFPLFANAMYNALGYGWGNSVLGFIAVAIGIPAPFFFWHYGERLRARSQFAAG